jgi:nucleolar protein 58
MQLLFETAAGFALFQVKGGEKFVEEAKDLGAEFATLEAAKKVVKLKDFRAFENITQALECAAATMDNKLSKDLKKALKKAEGSTLAVADAKLGNIIKEKLGIACVHGSNTMELMRGVRSQLEGLLEKEDVDLAPMSLGLSHSLSRYKLKFSADKVDTMIIQAIGLLDDLDKQLNIYAMRVREWYGWHFPEMVKVLSDNVLYAKIIQQVGFREAIPTAELSGLLDEDVEAALKEAALLSMGTEISQSDLDHVRELATQVIALSEYRAQLSEYLRNRMAVVAPNLMALVGELVGARLISHAGSLINLSKQPASTVQILGAEKALFRALKTKHETPKYGLIFHASLVGQASMKNKGKISRVLAAKCALATRVDALGDTTDATMGLENRAKVEARLRQIEGKEIAPRTPVGLPRADTEMETDTPGDVTKSGKKKRKDRDEDGEKSAKKAKKDKKDKKEKKSKK